MNPAPLLHIVPNVAPPKPLALVMPLHTALSMRPAVDPWENAKAKARHIAKHRLTIVIHVKHYVDIGLSQNQAIAQLMHFFERGELRSDVHNAMLVLAKPSRPCPSVKTIAQWCKDYKDAGCNPVGLLTEHKGKVVKPQDWWALACSHYNQPSKPSYMAVTRCLVNMYGFEVTVEQVKGYLQSLPAQYGQKGIARLGKNLHKLQQKAFKSRTTEHMLPGEIYAADGYSVDVYLAHPVSGGIWRMEMTAAIDVRSRYPVGWRADEHEGTVAVQGMWAEAITRWQHLPHSIYVDNGSGHKNKLMCDEVTGFYSRAGIEPIFAIPGNPHGKGWIERFFRTVRDDFLKTWKPQFYCGNDMAKEALDKTARDIQAGRLTLPSLAEFTHDFNLWLQSYVQRPHPEANAGGRTIAQVWAELQPDRPVHSLVELKREQVTVKVRRARLLHDNREYTHADLYAFNGQQVVLEYDLSDNAVGIVRTLGGTWICDSHLVGTMDVVDTTRLEEKRQKRAVGQLKRTEKKLIEQQSRAGLVIDAEAVASNGMLTIEGDYDCLPEPEKQQFSLDDFND